MPALSVVRELRRMKEQADREEFERFAAVNGRAVLDQVLNSRREAERDRPPSWMEGLTIHNRVRGVLLERFCASRRSAAHVK